MAVRARRFAVRDDAVPPAAAAPAPLPGRALSTAIHAPPPRYFAFWPQALLRQSTEVQAGVFVLIDVLTALALGAFTQSASLITLTLTAIYSASPPRPHARVLALALTVAHMQRGVLYRRVLDAAASGERRDAEACSRPHGQCCRSCGTARALARSCAAARIGCGLQHAACLSAAFGCPITTCGYPGADSHSTRLCCHRRVQRMLCYAAGRRASLRTYTCSTLTAL